MGGSDTLAQAESFANTYGGPDNLLWSESFVAWHHYRSGNPQLILLDGAGVNEIERQSGFNRGHIEDALASIT